MSVSLRNEQTDAPGEREDLNKLERLKNEPLAPIFSQFGSHRGTKRPFMSGSGISAMGAFDKLKVQNQTLRVQLERKVTENAHLKKMVKDMHHKHNQEKKALVNMITDLRYRLQDSSKKTVQVKTELPPVRPQIPECPEFNCFPDHCYFGKRQTQASAASVPERAALDDLIRMQSPTNQASDMYAKNTVLLFPHNDINSYYPCRNPSRSRPQQCRKKRKLSRGLQCRKLSHSNGKLKKSEFWCQHCKSHFRAKATWRPESNSQLVNHKCCGMKRLQFTVGKKHIRCKMNCTKAQGCIMLPVKKERS